VDVQGVPVVAYQGTFKDREAAKTSAAISASMDRAHAAQAANAKPKPTYSAFAKPRSFKDVDIDRQEAAARAAQATADQMEAEMNRMVQEAERMSEELSYRTEMEQEIVSEEEAKVLAKLNSWLGA
jgi:flagellar biosynthesis GTPase FlhF